MPKLCEFENCRIQATYGEFYGKPLRCNKHKENYKLVSGLCQQGNCSLTASYNYQGETKRRFCASHKLENMIDVISKTCEHQGCNIQPTYNYQGNKKGRFCVSHKLENMIDVKHKTCEHENCNIRPNYNYQGQITGRFCVSHKLENMVDITHKTCEHENCNVRSNYNYPGQNKARFCVSHKLENMIDIISKTCKYDGCNTQPIYNYPGQIIGIFCASHKLENMVDIKNKKCEHEGCNVLSNYNYKGEVKGRFCVSHKLESMVDIKHNKCKADFCLGTRANNKYKGYCTNCFQNLFPYDPLSFQIRSKTKEIAVRDYINSNFDGFQHDKPLWTGNCDCTHRRRIDHRKLIGNTLLCIETDENQHKGYDKVDEEIRYDDLFMLHGGKFVYIRFNPDKFKDKNGKIVNPMLYTRLPVLQKEIEKQINRIKNEENTELLEIVKLYYDE